MSLMQFLIVFAGFYWPVCLKLQCRLIRAQQWILSEMLKLRFLVPHMLWPFELRVSIMQWHSFLQFVIENLHSELSFWLLLVIERMLAL